MEQVEILFWRAFIELVSRLREHSQSPVTCRVDSLADQRPAGWQRYALFSALSLLGGVLIGFLFGHLF